MEIKYKCHACQRLNQANFRLPPKPYLRWLWDRICFWRKNKVKLPKTPRQLIFNCKKCNQYNVIKIR